MKKITAALALSLAVLLPFTATPAFAAAPKAQAELCAEAPAKAAKANIDCATTSSFTRDKDAAAKRYPSAPVQTGNGIVF
jgi:hypothetical protein